MSSALKFCIEFVCIIKLDAVFSDDHKTLLHQKTYYFLFGRFISETSFNVSIVAALLTTHMLITYQGRHHRGGGGSRPQLPAGPLFTEFAGTNISRQKVMVTLCISSRSEGPGRPESRDRSESPGQPGIPGRSEGRALVG